MQRINILLISSLVICYSCAGGMYAGGMLLAPVPDSGGFEINEKCLKKLREKKGKIFQARYNGPYYYYQIEEYGEWKKFHCWFD